MKLEKTKNTKRNIVSGLINKVVVLLLPFIVRTIIIKKLGAEYLGLNSLFSSILQVLNLSELGFASAVVYSMYKPIAKDDVDSICALLNFYRKVYRIVGIIILGAGLILMPFLPHIISGEVPDGLNIYVLYSFYLVNTVVSYLFLAYKVSLLNAHQRQDVVSNTLTLTQGLMHIFQIIIILTTKNYYLYLVLLPIFTLIYNVLNAIKVKRLYPQYVCRGKIHKREKDVIKKQVPGLMIDKLCMTSRNSFDSIFISAFLGLSATAMYGNYYYILSAVQVILQVMSNAILAGVGNSVVLDSAENNYKTMKKIDYLFILMAGWCSICMLCLYQPFMRVWVGEQYEFGLTTVVLMCMYFYVIEIGVIRGVYFSAAGLWWQGKHITICEVIANIVLNYFLGKYFGINGIIMATLITLFVINFCWGSGVVFKHYFKNNDRVNYCLRHVKYAAVTFVIGSVTYGLCSIVSLNKYLTILYRGAVCVVVPTFLYVAVYCRTKEYKQTLSWAFDKFKFGRKLSKFVRIDEMER